MNTRQEKMMRLADVARKYYIEDKKQSDIAKELGVSRPLISRMLTEAKALGLVEITIHDPWQRSAVFLEKLQKRWQIQDAVLQEDLEDDRSTNIMLSESTIGLLEKIGAKKIGIGWGHFIGQLVAWLEQHPQKDTGIQDIYPLLGNAGVPIRNYHSNENVRILAENLSATPHFLYLPALPESLEEKKLLCSTELYKQFEKNWQQIDAALVNIGNYPSTPDFASGVRYGNMLQKKGVCGRLLAYYFNEQGEIMDPSQDFAIQASLEALQKCKAVIGLCSANTSVKALRGALETKLFTHIVARTELIREVLQ